MDLTGFIAELAKAPDTQIDMPFRKRCQEFDGVDALRFLRDLRDELVHCGASSDFVIRAIGAYIDRDPEPIHAVRRG